MLYQEYKSKIEKRMAFWKRLRRWRVPIITVLAIVLLLAISFVATKGMVTGDTLLDEKIEYGKEPVFSAKALFADVWYEYKTAEGGEWTREAPTEMGEYRVRAVSKGIFGQRYGEEAVFYIVPRVIEVSVDGERVVYGENPLPTASLAFEDRVICGEFVFADTTKPSTEVTPVLSSIVIKDKDGADVTHCYQISVKTKTVFFDKRDITVIVDSKETEYNGEVHTHEVWQVAQGGGLVYDDLLVKVEGSFVGATNVGTVTNKGQFRVLRATENGTADVTHQYNINQIAGSLTITQRPVVILPEGGEYTYDGVEHSEPYFEVADKSPLVSGHTASVGSAPTIKDVGEINNLPIIVITDAEGNVVTSNYCITYEGDYILKVNPLDTHITSENASLVYNGEEQTAERFYVTEGFYLAEGHMAVVASAATVKGIGTYTNELFVSILDENGVDVTENYNISYVYGEINVAKRDISITSGSLNGTYNGQAQGEKGLILVKDQLVGGHKIEATFHNTVIDCGVVLQNSFDALIFDENGVDVTENYEIARVFGTLEVQPLTVRITTDGWEKTYDGTPLKLESFSYVSGSAQIVEGHTVEYIGAPSITDAPQLFTEIENRFTIKIYEGEVDKTFNYNIIYEGYGYLTIIQRQLLVSADNYTKTYYDGLPIEDLTYTLGGEGVAPNQRAVVETYVEERTKAGTWRYRITGVKIYDANGVDVTSNYTVETQSATVYIGKRPILVTSNGFASPVYYDGEQHKEETYVLSSPAGEPLAVGESIKVSFNRNSYVEYATKDVENKFTVSRIYNEQTGERTTSNYEISTVYGTLHLEKRPVYLISDSIPENTVVYDGYRHQQKSFTDDRERGMGIVSGQRVNAVYEGYIVNAGQEENIFYVSAIYDRRGTDVIGSYDITCENGILRVYPRPITLTSQSATKVYDDNRLTCEDVLIGGLGVADGEYVEFSNFTYQHGAGSTTNEFDYVIKYISGGEVPPTNYEVTVDFAGVLEVTKRPIYITINSAEKVYDGKVLYPAGYSTPRYDDVYERGEGILPYHTLTMKLVGERWLVGTQVIEYTDLKITHDINIGGVSATSGNYAPNYELIIIDGTLTVTERDIIVDAPDQTKEYDGMPLVGELTSNDIGGLGLGFMDTIQVLLSGEQTEVGTSVSQVTYFRIYHGATDVTHCYNIVETLDGTLTITPRQITITVLGDVKEYYDGGAVLPQGYEVDRLLEGHSITLEMTGAQINVGTGYADVVDGSVKIFNLSGEDKTYNYEYSVVLGELTVQNKRPITVTSASDSFIFDNTPHKNESYVIGGMGLATEREEYEIVIFENSEFLNAGTYENRFSVGIFVSATGEDVTGNYEIEPIFGTIEIVRVQITVTTGSATKEFDLLPLTSSEISVSSPNLPAGYRIEAETVGTITDAGSVPNRYIISVFNEKGQEVSLANYEIINELGTLTVEPIRLTITSGSAEKIYDGEYLTENSFVSNWEETEAYKSGRLNLVVTVTGRRRDVGRSNNTFIVGLYDKSGVNHIKGNCEITEVLGTLTVYAEPITIESNSVTVTYNGREVASLYATITEGSLGKSHTLNVEMSGGFVNAGTYENRFTYDIVDKNGASVMEFYREVECIFGQVVIEKRHITITPISVTQQYNGEALYAPSEIELPNEYLDKLNSNPGYVYTYTIDSLSDIFVANAGEMRYYTIPAGRVHIYLNGDALDMDSFEIVSEQAFLKLSEKLLEINIFKVVKAYSGKLVAYNEDDWYLREGQLPEGYVLDLRLEGGRTEVGSLDFSELLEQLILNDRIHVYDENGVDVTARYDFVLVGTPLTVTERALELTAGSAQKYYDGEELTLNEYKITGGSLAKGHKISVCKIVGSVTDVDSVSNRIMYVVIVDQNGEEVTENYNISYIDGVLEVLDNPQ